MCHKVLSVTHQHTKRKAAMASMGFMACMAPTAEDGRMLHADANVLHALPWDGSMHGYMLLPSAAGPCAPILARARVVFVGSTRADPIGAKVLPHQPVVTAAFAADH